MVFAMLRTIIRGISAIMLVIAILPAMSAQAAMPADPDDLASRKSQADAEVARSSAVLEYATGRAQEAHAALQTANSQLPGAQLALAEAQGSVIAARAEAAEAQRAAEAAAAELATAQEQYDKVDTSTRTEQRRFNAFAGESYMSGQYATSMALLAVEDPEDLVAAIEYVHGLAAEREVAVERMRKARLAAGETKATMAALEEEAATTNQLATEALTTAQTRESEASAAATAVESLIAQRAASATVAEEERSASEARYAEWQAQSAELEAELRAVSVSQPAPAESGSDSGSGWSPPPRAGQLRKPVQGWKSSDFGSRFDPYYGVWQLHAGVDFAAPGGAPIYAAASGRVVRTGWNGGYGNYTCIHHGDTNSGGLATCYAHQSQILAGNGQWVSDGELIGLVGTTGASTGYHLHFEVRLDGTPVDPLNWLL